VALARALANSKNISTTEAEQELLRFSGAPDFAIDDFAALTDLITRVLDAVKNVHEVQLYGGASQLRYIYDVVDLAVRNHSAYSQSLTFLGFSINHVRRDFDPDFALLDAALSVVALAHQFRSAQFPVALSPRPIVSYFAHLGQQTKKYCHRNTECRDTFFEFRKPTETVNITADDQHVPFGAPTLANVYRLTNISEIKLYRGSDVGNLHLQFRAPEPVVTATGYRNKTGYCPVGVEPVAVYQEEMNKSVQFFLNAIRAVAPNVALEIRRDAVEDRIAKAERVVEVMGASRQSKAACRAWREKLANGTVGRMSVEELRKAIQEIELPWKTVARGASP
jgi:hypothetical protein